MSSQFPLYVFYEDGGATPRTLEIYAKDLERLVGETVASWSEKDEALFPYSLEDGKWSVKQVFGHLCDSAVNNLQRVVRLAAQDGLIFPRYHQEHWVRVQRYEARTFREVLDLFRILQLHFAHTIRNLDPTQLENQWLDEDAPKTMRHIIEDYLGHLRHHLTSLPCF